MASSAKEVKSRLPLLSVEPCDSQCQWLSLPISPVPGAGGCHSPSSRGCPGASPAGGVGRVSPASLAATSHPVPLPSRATLQRAGMAQGLEQRWEALLVWLSVTREAWGHHRAPHHSHRAPHHGRAGAPLPNPAKGCSCIGGAVVAKSCRASSPCSLNRAGRHMFCFFCSENCWGEHVLVFGPGLEEVAH